MGLSPYLVGVASLKLFGSDIRPDDRLSVRYRDAPEAAVADSPTPYQFVDSGSGRLDSDSQTIGYFFRNNAPTAENRASNSLALRQTTAGYALRGHRARRRLRDYGHRKA